MMLRFFAVAGFLLWMSVGVAHADIDYKCLNQCVSNGGGTAKCQTNCTYEPVKQPKTKTKAEAREVISVPLPVAGEAEAPKAKKVAIPSTPETDWVCYRGCMTQGHVNSYCRQTCVRR